MWAVVPNLFSLSSIWILQGRRTVSNTHNLKQSVRFRDLELARNPKQREENNHRTTTGSKPERSSNAVIVADETGSKHGGTP